VLIQSTFGAFPSLPIRLCETILGRLSIHEFLLIVPVHFACLFSTIVALKHTMPEELAATAFEAIPYSSKNPWWQDFLREAAVNALFVVGFLVLPELLRVNKFRSWIAFFLLYPLYNMPVDAEGMGSTLGPTIVYGLEFDLHDWYRIAGIMGGGIVAGIIMRTIFPDDRRD